MSNQSKNIPKKSYAVKHELPELSDNVKKTLTSIYGRDGRQSAKNNQVSNLPTYLIRSKNIYYQGPFQFDSDANTALPHGFGIAIYPDHSYYQGEFNKGQANDKNSTLILPNGALYKGQIVNSTINGKGVLTHREINYSYEGTWKDGKPHGYGKQIYGDGSHYEGQFKEGIKDGKGTYYCNLLNQTYEGEFLNGAMNGKGKLSKNGKVYYEGLFEKGAKRGKGTLQIEDGILQGDFENDVINGQGVFTWSDGKVYTGSFKNSKFHGKGSIKYKSGQKVDGEWEQGHNKFLTTVQKV